MTNMIIVQTFLGREGVGRPKGGQGFDCTLHGKPALQSLPECVLSKVPSQPGLLWGLPFLLTRGLLSCLPSNPQLQTLSSLCGPGLVHAFKLAYPDPSGSPAEQSTPENGPTFLRRRLCLLSLHPTGGGPLVLAGRGLGGKSSFSLFSLGSVSPHWCVSPGMAAPVPALEAQQRMFCVWM